jgi:hypothetical protein
VVGSAQGADQVRVQAVGDLVEHVHIDLRRLGKLRKIDGVLLQGKYGDAAHARKR